MNLEDKAKVIVIHNHLFKNAGSTIDWALKRNFGQHFVDHRDDQSMLKIPGYLEQYIAEHQNIKVLSSHHLRLPLPTTKNCKFMTIMMFRHPIERVMSVYAFEKKQTHADTLGSRFAREHNLKEYVLWRMGFDVPPTIRNFHLFKSLAAPVDWRKEMGAGDLSRAKDYVDSLEMIGIVEQFDESMVLFEKMIGEAYGQIDLSYKRQNITNENEESVELRIERIRKEIGEDVFSLLLDRNKADMELYEYARKVFAKKLREIKNPEFKLKDLRDRCHRQKNFFQRLMS